MSKRFLLILAAILAVFVGAIAISKQNKDNGQPAPVANTTNHTQGNGKVTLIEYGDFQCPACASYYPLLKSLKADYGDKFTFKFSHYPLVSIHQNAMAAHRAAEAAAKQDKFWEMHDTLYERQTVWASSQNASRIFEDYATELGLNIDQFKQDVASGEVNDIINSDVKAAQAAGATSTPTFVLEGKKIDNAPQDVDGFKKLIDEAIANKQSD